MYALYAAVRQEWTCLQSDRLQSNTNTFWPIPSIKWKYISHLYDKYAYFLMGEWMAFGLSLPWRYNFPASKHSITLPYVKVHFHSGNNGNVAKFEPQNVLNILNFENIWQHQQRFSIWNYCRDSGWISVFFWQSDFHRKFSPEQVKIEV